MSSGGVVILCSAEAGTLADAVDSRVRAADVGPAAINLGVPTNGDRYLTTYQNDLELIQQGVNWLHQPTGELHGVDFCSPPSTQADELQQPSQTAGFSA